MSLSKTQMKLFFAEVSRAAENVGESTEDYRKGLLRQELGVEHMSDVTPGKGFDKLMQRVYADQGEYEKAIKFAVGDLNRMRHLARRTATRILLDRGVPDPGEVTVHKYIASIFVQMRFSYLDRDALAFNLINDGDWENYTLDQVRRVVQALSIHARRKS